MVMRSTGSWHLVQGEGIGLIECRIKGKLRIAGIRTTNPVAVGDRIKFVLSADGEAVIREVEQRQNYIERKAVNLSKHSQVIASNIDHAYLVVTLNDPPTSTGFIDRFLVSAEATSIPVSIIFNKTDIYDEAAHQLLQAYEHTYESVGYPCIRMSAIDVQRVAMLRPLLLNRTSLLSGHSGVGKSTLINAIEPSLQLKTGEVSAHHFKGKHTTTFAEMFSLSAGGYIIDTPGIKGLGIVDIEKTRIARCFPEIRQTASECRFHDCAHISEPECAIKLAVEANEIAHSRYASYVAIHQTDEQEKYR